MALKILDIQPPEFKDNSNSVYPQPGDVVSRRFLTIPPCRGKTVPGSNMIVGLEPRQGGSLHCNGEVILVSLDETVTAVFSPIGGLNTPLTITVRGV